MAELTSGLNIYAYVGNDPLDLVDPSGFDGQAALGPYGLLALGGTTVCAAAEPCGLGEAAIIALTVGAGAAVTAQQNQQALPHGNSLDSPRQTYLYQLTDNSNGIVLKYGITSEPNPTSRYTASFYTATNSQMQVIVTYNNRILARIGELNANIDYFLGNGSLPPLSAVP